MLVGGPLPTLPEPCHPPSGKWSCWWSPSLQAVARLRLQAAGTGSARQTRDAEFPSFFVLASSTSLLGDTAVDRFLVYLNLGFAVCRLPGWAGLGWGRDGPEPDQSGPGVVMVVALFFCMVDDQTPARSWLCLLGKSGSQ